MLFFGSIRSGLSWFNWWVSFARELQCCYFCESSCLFYLSFNFDFYVSGVVRLWVRGLPSRPGSCVSEGPRRSCGRGLVDRKLVASPSNFIAGRPRAALLFWLFSDFGCGVPLFVVGLVFRY